MNWLTEENAENLGCQDPEVNRDLRDSSAMRHEMSAIYQSLRRQKPRTHNFPLLAGGANSMTIIGHTTAPQPAAIPLMKRPAANIVIPIAVAFISPLTRYTKAIARSVDFLPINFIEKPARKAPTRPPIANIELAMPKAIQTHISEGKCKQGLGQNSCIMIREMIEMREIKCLFTNLRIAEP